MELVCLYSHDGEGLGHLRRNTNIAQAAVGLPGVSALLLTGCQVPNAFGYNTSYDTVKIPTLIKNGCGCYRSSIPGMSGEETLRLRREMLRSVICQVRPSAFIVDKYPGGLKGELVPALEWLKRHSPGTKLVLGLRDILDDPEQTAKEWEEGDLLELAGYYYDRVWIYGDRGIFDTATVYGFPEDLRRRCRYCGYLVGDIPHMPAATDRIPYIVATVGGGRDGLGVLKHSVEAVERLRKTHRRLNLFLFAGPLMADDDYVELRRLSARMGSWVFVDRFSYRFKRYLVGAEAAVTMGGYNTMLECLKARCPTVVIPREYPRTEQLIRARTFEKHGFVHMVREQEGVVDQLAEVLGQIVDKTRRTALPDGINLQGYQTVRKELTALIGHRTPEVRTG